MAEQRDFIGYGNQIPKVVWPNRCQIAINFVLNYEEGAESNILDGDETSESYLADLPGVIAFKKERHLSVESLFEYGSRCGIWRLLDLFKQHSIPITIFACGLALERNFLLAEEIKNSPHEIAGHGYRWINYRYMSEMTEKEHIDKTLTILQTLTHKKVVGWYTGRKSSNTRKLVVEKGLIYDSDSYADDYPYWLKVTNTPHLVIPYNLDCNDARYATSPGWNSSQDFYLNLKATFDQLYREGETFPKLMTIGLHSRLSGKPGRTDALHRFLDYIKKYKNIWFCRREEIAQIWYQNHYPQG